MIKLNKDTIIYVACPPNFSTGGPELLHQLVFKLNSRGVDARIFYFPLNYESNPTEEIFQEYIDSFATNIDDDRKNILIVPETMTRLLFGFQNIQKVIWWLSVDHYQVQINGLRKWIGMFLKIDNVFNIHSIRMQRQIYIHLVQSKYAEEYLKRNNINNIKYLSDYLRRDFLDRSKKNMRVDKQDIVLYNPKKGMLFTRKLIERFPDLHWKPIVNYTPPEVVKLMASAKVYIDFGYHPGKDRIPRESAILGCCVITNKKGSAYYEEDVPILKEFKFDETDNNISDIGKTIQQCISNYAEEIKKFEKYRIDILNQENKFDREIDIVFKYT